MAETGDLTRFASARSVVKHSGLAPREKNSGIYVDLIQDAQVS